MIQVFLDIPEEVTLPAFPALGARKFRQRREAGESRAALLARLGIGMLVAAVIIVIILGVSGHL